MIKVLIVDDDREVREMLRSMFLEWADEHDCKLDVREYENGNNTVTDIEKTGWCPDIASVDFMMENGDGIGVVKYIRTKTKQAPILVITAWPEAEGFKTIINECIIVSKTDIEIIDETINQEMNQLDV